MEELKKAAEANEKKAKSAPAAEDRKIVPAAAANSPFYQSIMKVIESGSNHGFKNIQGAKKAIKNFWNYKYTYATNVKVPGEKYNMIYAFPFESSQLDFVSVLYETDAYSSTLETTYHSFESKLLKEFPESEGWSKSYAANDDKSKPKDLQLKHPKIGTIMLDYSRNPAGRHVLYIRFLFQYS